MLQLRDPELELFEVRPRDEAELLEETVEPGARSLGEANRLAAPAVNRLIDHLAGLVSADPTCPRELVRKSVGALGGQCDRADRGQPDPLERLCDEATVISGH